MKNILILNGSPRKNGSTNKLLQSFKNGAKNNDIKEFYLYDMQINGCMGCDSCKANGKKANPCVQEDDMKEIYDYFLKADVVVFVSPLYFWTITGPLKTVADRLYAILNSRGYQEFEKESILIMTAGGSDYSQAQKWYETYERNLNWVNLGEILGAYNIQEAEKLGKDI